MLTRQETEADADTGARTGARGARYWARTTPGAIAVVEAGYRYPYADMTALIVKTVKHLQALALPVEPTIGIECSSRFMHLVLILACECLGATTVSFVPSDITADNELLARCTLLCLETPTKTETASHLPPILPLNIDLISTIARATITVDDDRLLDVRPEPLAGGRIVRTSGTTGKPKCMRNSNIGIWRAVETTQLILNLLEGSANFLCLYPFSFRPSYTDSILALRSGRTIVFTDLPSFFRDMVMIGDSHTVILPTDAVTLCATFSGPKNPAIKCAVQVNGGALGPTLRRTLNATFATTVCNTYSTNETNYISLVNGNGVGALLPGVEVRIVGNDGLEIPHGKTGRIMVRSPRMVPAYIADDAATARHFVDGWHMTGDLGFQPGDRQLVVLGRADDMLNIGGIKVPPQPIETEIRTIAGITDAVLLSIDDRQGVSALHVVIERRGSDQDPELDRQIRPLIQRHGRDFVAHYLDILPRTPTGKVRRDELRAQIAGRHPETRSGQNRASGEAATTDRTAS
jgi:acyl-CoA synthetase (AMP-forming)/AMP-acid ligase II